MTSSPSDKKRGRVSSRWVRWPEAAGTLALAAIIVFWMPGAALARLLRRHEAAAASAKEPGSRRAEAAAVAATVDRLGRMSPYRPRCLVRAVCVHLMLRRRGIPHAIHIGVRKEDGRVLGHAWVEVAGRILIGGAARPCFRLIARFGGEPS